MRCEEVKDSAAGLASLALDDEDRMAAFEHARACAACASALAEGERLLSLIDALPPPPAPSADVLQRVAAEIRAELAAESGTATSVPARRQQRWWPEGPVAATGAVLVAVAFVVALLQWYHRPAPTRIWVEAFFVVGLAGAGAAVSLLRRSPWVPLGLLGVSIGFALLRGSPHEIVRAHDCSVLELIAASVTLVPAVLAVAIRRVRGGFSTLAGMSAAGALAGQAALDVVCRGNARLEHLLVWHVGGILIALLAGGALSALPPLRARARA